MIQSGSQLALDGSSAALLILITYFCQAAPPEGEERAQCILLLYIARMMETLDAPPSSLTQLQQSLHRAFASYPETYEGLHVYLANWFDLLDNVDGLTELFHAKLPECLHHAHEDVPEGAQLLDRRSYLGVYVRRARLAFEMLLDSERLQLAAICAAWRSGAPQGLADEWHAHSQARAYKQWCKSARRGDYEAAKNELHAFFDLTLPGCDQELHQHALLNLAQFYVDTQGYVAARTTLDEAILLARTVGDTECMRACDELLQKLAYLDPEPTVANEWLLTQRETDTQLACGAYAPLTLWKANLHREQGKPLLEIVQALADAAWASRSRTKKPGTDWEPRPSIERSAACPSAVLARTWLQLGVPSLAEAYVQHIERLGQSTPSWRDLQLSAAETKAFAETEKGAYDAAIHALVKPSVIELLRTLRQFNTWQTAIWQVLYTRARRQRHVTTLNRLAELCPDLREWSEVHAPNKTSALQQLDDARKILAAKQPYQTLDALMQSIATAEQQHLYPVQRSGVALLAEIMTTSFSIADQALSPTLAEIMPQALADANPERRAYTENVYAKTLLASRDTERARYWLTKAEQDFASTENYSEQAACLYMHARIAQHLGDIAARDTLSQAYTQVRARELDAATSLAEDPALACLHTLVEAVRRRVTD
ncbi:hypothetical protein MOBT1_001558 [Malassezia obtusa]|uniref:Anaphase-promoting complex subunit 5 n=1 Tax=Malassezia obtusa TaxID=76774 RepID=A0AAF0IWC0_9BASI|nr:hypothetical protein MOBT1_001558 [Malassezia obtusa]